MGPPMEGIENLPTWVQAIVHLAVLLVAAGAAAYGGIRSKSKQNSLPDVPPAGSLPQQMVVQQAIERAVLEQEIKGNQMAMIQKLERLHHELDGLYKTINNVSTRVDDIWEEVHGRRRRSNE